MKSKGSPFAISIGKTFPGNRFISPAFLQSPDAWGRGMISWIRGAMGEQHKKPLILTRRGFYIGFHKAPFSSSPYGRI
jgi:hypothetical protein